MTQLRLVRKAGLQKKIVGQYENGQVVPHITRMIKLAKAFGFMPSSLLDCIDEILKPRIELSMVFKPQVMEWYFMTLFMFLIVQ